MVCRRVLFVGFFTFEHQGHGIVAGNRLFVYVVVLLQRKVNLKYEEFGLMNL